MAASGRPLRAVIGVTARGEVLCFNGAANEMGVSTMSYHQRPHELRLAISTEAEALMISFGDQAYAEACMRAGEASSDFLARDWNEVAQIVARKTRKRPTLFAQVFH
jgi:hypothetical protein